MFYDVYCLLCKEKGVSPSKAATEIGLNKSLVSHWKSGNNSLKDETLKKMASYFKVPIAVLLEQAPYDVLTIIDEHKEEFVKALPIPNEILEVWKINKDCPEAAPLFKIIDMMSFCIKWCDITENGWAIALDDDYIKLTQSQEPSIEFDDDEPEVRKVGSKPTVAITPGPSKIDRELADMIKKLTVNEKIIVKKYVNEILFKRSRSFYRARRGVAVSKK